MAHRPAFGTHAYPAASLEWEGWSLVHRDQASSYSAAASVCEMTAGRNRVAHVYAPHHAL